MTRPFYFLRHGQTDWNVVGRLQGRTDIHLNETGHVQARAAAAVFKAHPITRIITSPLRRAAVTANYIAEHLNLPLLHDDRLMERHYGSIEGMTHEEIAAHPPEKFHDLSKPLDWAGYQPMLPGNGETMDEIADRAQAAALDLLQAYPDDTLLFVSHGTWFRGLVYRLAQQDMKTGNATPFRLAPTGSSWTVDQLT